VPTYEYECRSCKRSHEVQHGINDPGPTTCEDCGGDLRRVFYPPGLVFKGTGFYSTDGRFGRAADKRDTFKKDDGKSDTAASKDSAAASSSRPSGSRSSGDRSSGDRSSGDRSSGDRSSGDRSSGERAGTEKSA
jgi:putative FmdB family regulatory protein